MPICNSISVGTEELKFNDSHGAALGLSRSDDNSEDWTAELRVTTPRVKLLVVSFSVRIGSQQNSSWEAKITLRPEYDATEDSIVTHHDLSQSSEFTVKGEAGSTAVRPIFVDLSKFLKP